MIDKNDILQKAEKLVYDKLHAEASGHDWWHAVRVKNTARELAEKEGADSFICQLTALVHDMADEKLNDDPKKTLADLKTWLIDQQLSLSDVEHIIQIINTMSFKGDGSSVPATLEGKIVQDADRLDAIGAIGIARCMAYSGSKGRPIHDPNMTAREAINASKELMDGHKGELFWLELTFIGWILLCALTGGIGTFFLAPYQNAAYAAFYRDITHPNTVTAEPVVEF